VTFDFKDLQTLDLPTNNLINSSTTQLLNISTFYDHRFFLYASLHFLPGGQLFKAGSPEAGLLV
jgi:hypothetical protein